MPARQNFQTSFPFALPHIYKRTKPGKKPHQIETLTQFTLGVLKTSWAVISPPYNFIPLKRWPCLIKRLHCYCHSAFWSSLMQLQRFRMSAAASCCTISVCLACVYKSRYLFYLTNLKAHKISFRLLTRHPPMTEEPGWWSYISY